MDLSVMGSETHHLIDDEIPAARTKPYDRAYKYHRKQSKYRSALRADKCNHYVDYHKKDCEYHEQCHKPQHSTTQFYVF